MTLLGRSIVHLGLNGNNVATAVLAAAKAEARQGKAKGKGKDAEERFEKRTANRVISCVCHIRFNRVDPFSFLV